jgi:hypothetical protein
MGKKSGSRSGIRIRGGKPGSNFRELRNHFFGLKYLTSLMRIRDPGSGMEKIWIRDPGWKNLDPESGIWDGKNSDSGSGIKDKHPGSAKLEISSPNLLGQNRVIIEPFVEKAFWDKTKSFLRSKAASVALKRGKTPVNWIFHSPTRHGRRRQTSGAKPLLQLTFIRP